MLELALMILLPITEASFSVSDQFSRSAMIESDSLKLKFSHC